MAVTNSSGTILLTIDVEDWFQVENFKSLIPFSSWPSFDLRVERNTLRLLDLFDRFRSTKGDDGGGGARISATFFILGWIAEKLPGLVREIAARGHEVASHGFNHHLLATMTPDALCEDLIRSRKLLEDITGEAVEGFRAPSFSISNRTLRVIEDCGYRYDSSFNSFALHDRYGTLDLSGFEKQSVAYRSISGFHEIPISNLHVGDTVFPLGGGGYFRLLPSFLFRMGVRKILSRENAYLFYLHPWELDPGQPVVQDAPPGAKFRHYSNLSKTESRLGSLIEAFSDCPFLSCREYLEEVKAAV